MMPNWTKADLRNEFAKRLKAFDSAIILNLAYVGERCVTQARNLKTYRDRTGNLRSSVGYLIVHNGKVRKSGFNGSSVAGKTTGRALAEELASSITGGYALIVVAGMNYALLVESRGLDVLTSAEQLAQTELPRLLSELKITVEPTR